MQQLLWYVGKSEHDTGQIQDLAVIKKMIVEASDQLPVKITPAAGISSSGSVAKSTEADE